MRYRSALMLAALTLTLVWGAGLGAAHMRSNLWFLERVEATLTDLRILLRGSRPAPDALTIVAIDDQTVQRTGSYPLARARIAELIDAIGRARPNIIAVDMLFLEAGAAEGDAALAAALARTPSIIAGAAVFQRSSQRAGAGGALLDRIPDAESFLLPLPRFSEAAQVGIVNVGTDQSGTPREIPMIFRSGSDIRAAFPLQAAALSLGVEPVFGADGIELGGRHVATDSGQALPLAFHGPRGTIRTISAAAILDGSFDPADISGKVVVLGTTVTGGGDVFPTPFDQVLPGVEVIATAIGHLVADGGITRNRFTHRIDAATAILLPMLLVTILAFWPNAPGLAAMGAVLVCWLALNALLFSNGLWLSISLPLTAIGPPVLIFGALQLLLNRRRAQHFASQSRMLQAIQAPGLGKWLARHPDFLALPVRQDAAVIFIDLSGFTGLSEILGPNSTRDLLNGFYQMVDEEVAASGGSIISFMGDGAMILFGLPAPKPDDAQRALGCAVSLCGRTGQWLATLPSSTSERIGYKVGAHFGTVVASRLGGGERQQITATGDTVNIASRLMEIAKANRAELALSSEILHVAGPDNAASARGTLTGPLEAEIRGRSGAVTIWLWRGG
ncbi:adenylate/guanylate cyclase domain-containing protein [Phyllobacterium sp. 21LDTY02-6]|uniref:CHASE2 domain-containing protein n=1 Tax=Phyllobacterium sp. 21LDTY02-6 TaxID=2944903 RepID=UPI0020227F85|nr:adenylate/guanylate cyclase domain-containing protein [Phyllobacterium sp. 21LDTY02-6]MCO4318790.1 adenylate/guanylate cyclase domain-containing protein [Phyllobacterium sp. 21LDTY02-6]